MRTSLNWIGILTACRQLARRFGASADVGLHLAHIVYSVERRHHHNPAARETARRAHQ